MAKYKHKGSVTTHHFEKVNEPKKGIDWDAVGGFIVLAFIVIALLSNCAG